MERLTVKENGHYYYPRCFEGECDGASERCEDCEFEAEVCMRLGQYEDSGLTPEQINEMKGALSRGNTPEFTRSSRDNDGWIPVNERLPEKNEYFVETSSDKDFPNGYYKRLEVAYMTDIIEYVHGYYDGYKWMDKYLDTIENVLAWRILEPYRPERTKP